MAPDRSEPPASQLISLADYERAAEGLIDAAAFGYYFGGAGDEITLRDNVVAWNRFAIRPRVLVGVGRVDPRITLLSKPRPHPLIVAPMAWQRLAHADGEVATGRACEATGTIMCLSSLATTSASALAQALPGAPRWFQLYVLSDRGFSRELMAQAADHGYEALVVTVDLPVVGVREREQRASVRLANLDLALRAALASTAGSVTPAEFADLVDPDLKWSDIEQLATDSPLPVIVKGILTAEDARQAAERGARGVVVSNHGGRQLDTVLSGADALASVVDAVGDVLEVIVDGGIRRGTDVLKALALGARAVMIGRPLLWGLAVGGADGARQILETLLTEFDIALALAGAPIAAELDRSFVMPAPWVAG
jgi:isopentenyl diphosphate isomerase/L-lactate dehydrogenase-like FMN-dependent dehydrogenase